MLNKLLEKFVCPAYVAAFGSAMMVFIGYILCVRYPMLKDVFSAYCTGLAAVLTVFVGHNAFSNWAQKAETIVNVGEKESDKQ